MVNLDRVEKHNAGHSTYLMGLNHFADLTSLEFSSRYLAPIPVNPISKIELSKGAEEYIDWVEKGAVTPVQDQKQCGSSPYYGAVGALESLNKIAYGKLEVLSVQQIVDCSGDYGNYGCNGGWMNATFQYVMDHGITTEEKYPYRGVNQQCKTNVGEFKISGYKNIPKGDCDSLARAILAGPVAIATDATNWSLYKSGIFDDCKAMINHGVCVVGVAQDYWKVKNTWTTAWGENGYIRLARGNTCGICDAASYPIK